MMTDSVLSPQDAHVLLDWHSAAGVDLAVGEMPVDRFAASSLAAAPAISPVVAASKQRPPMAAPAADQPAEGDPDASRALAAAAETMDALAAAMAGFDGCALKLRATQLVFGDGNPDADIMLIGEAPGREEDMQGKPFVGRSGQLLDKMLAAIGLDRTKVFIANTVPWRPPGNRTPTPTEIATCLPFLHRQIELVAPKFILTLGAPAAQTVFDTTRSISRLRGQWQDIEIGTVQVRALPTLHPAFLLRQPAQKQLAWRDLLALQQAVESPESSQA